MRKYRLLILLIPGLFMPISHCMAIYLHSGYVGETIRLESPSSTHGNEYERRWNSTDPYSLTINESTPSVTINKYFSGEEYVTCTIYYQAEPGYTHHNSEDVTYRIVCKKTKIENLPSSLTMEVGDKRELNWTWSPHSAKKPNITWEPSYSSSCVAYVNQYDELVANSPGTVYMTGKNDCGDDVEITVTVKSIPVTDATIESSYSVEADGTCPVSVSVTPSNGTINTINWESEKKDIATFNSSGELVGVWPGKTKIWCTVNESVRSNDAEVEVVEPTFVFKGFSVTNGTTGVETRPTIVATFSHTLSQGENYNKIALNDATGQPVAGTLTMSDKTLQFTPSRHLKGLSQYTWTIPARAVKNKWGTDYPTAQSVSFTTTDWKRMTLSAVPETKFLSHGTEITLSCSSLEASIYYSTDGSNPTTRYVRPIVFMGDMTLRAVARQDGYYDSDELKKDYLTSVEIAEKYPGDEPLYNYADVNPSITYTYPIEAGPAFSGIVMTKDYGQNVDCQLLIQDKTLYLIPSEPLQNGSLYVVKLPVDAFRVKERGERGQAYEWTFAAGDYATAVSMGGPELGASLKTDGSVWTWGRRLTYANADDGSYSFSTINNPNRFVDGDVIAVSSGYTHHAVIKHDGSLWMWGRQLCGEFGNGTYEASVQPIKVMDGVKSVACGVQTTAVLKEDGTLWMCGRNDLGQIDATRTVYTSYQKVAEAVDQVQLNWGSLTIVNTDGTTDTRTWDETIDNQRAQAGNLLENVTQVEYGWQNAVALVRDGSVWVWNQNNSPKEIIAGRNPKPVEGVSLSGETLNMEKGEHAVIPSKPVPLLADYSTLTWRSNNESVATVSQSGVVTAITDGIAILTANIADIYGTAFEATYTVKVGEVHKDVTDIVATINYILGERVLTEVEFELLDMNNDGNLNVGDVILLVKAILEQGNVVNVPAMARGDVESIDLTKFTAMQMTVSVPAGTRIRSIRLAEGNNSSHQLMFKQTDAEHYMAVVYSMNNQTFKPVSGCLLEVEADGKGEPTTSNVLLATPKGERTFLSTLPIGIVTSVSVINDDRAASGDIYDLRGNKVFGKGLSTRQLPKGVYIMNGKKIIR